MRINKAYSPELQRDLRDIKQRLEKADTRGLPQGRRIVGGGGGATKPIQTKTQVVNQLAPGTLNGDLYINGTLLVNGSEPLYSESDLLDPTFADPVRAINTVYQNTENTMKIVQIIVKLTA